MWSGGANSNSRVSDQIQFDCTNENGFSYQAELTVTNPDKNTTEFNCLSIKPLSGEEKINNLQIYSVQYRILETPRPTLPIPDKPEGEGWQQIDLTGYNPKSNNIYISNSGSLVILNEEYITLPLGRSFNTEDTIEVYITGISYAEGQNFRIWSGDRFNSRASIYPTCSAPYANTFKHSISLIYDPNGNNPKDGFNKITICAPSGQKFEDLEITSVWFKYDAPEIEPTPSASAKPTVTPAVPEGYVKVDLSTLKSDKQGNGATGKYDKTTGQVTINDTAKDVSYGFTLPESVEKDDRILIRVQGTYTGNNPFRVWIANGFYNNGSNITQQVTYSKGEFDVEVDVTIIRDDCDTVMVKSMSGQTIDGVIIDNIYLKNITPEDPYAPVKVDLSKMTCDADYAQYDTERGLIKVNDNRTGDGDSSTMYIPIPVTVVPGQTIKVTISGPKWDDNDFRIWTTPSGEITSGNYVENNQIYLNPIKNDDGSFTKTVELVAKDKNCDYITLKPTYGTKIKGLVISEITVQLIK